MRIPVAMLGQSGCRLVFDKLVLYIDPYLSDSVAELDSPDLKRLRRPPHGPSEISDANLVLLTHEHIDHCDPHTLPALSLASPQARFIGPAPVLANLRAWGIADERLTLAKEEWTPIGPELQLRAVPAAHPKIERNQNGELLCVGYLLEFQGKRLYIAGDTSVARELVDTLSDLRPIHSAFLPVNERNYFRERRGIIGNMSVREAFGLAAEIGVQQMVAVHWDMFAANSVEADEIRLLHKRLNPAFRLLLNPTVISLGDVQISYIIRTLNEAQHLGELLAQIRSQQYGSMAHEVVLVDSGSTDETLQIARDFECHIHHITREEFSFGRSLNVGCNAAHGDILVITSGHCVPQNDEWAMKLCRPIVDGEADYSYGRQLGGQSSRFSEVCIFEKYFPASASAQPNGFFCNNANAALARGAWDHYRFDEDLTGLEDLELAQRLVRDGGRVEYVHDAAVYHYHAESWAQVKRRFQREAIALQSIMPHLHINRSDFFRYLLSSVGKDWIKAWRAGCLFARGKEILLYRWNQYLGSYRGNHEHRLLSHAEKEKYFYPDTAPRIGGVGLKTTSADF